MKVKPRFQHLKPPRLFRYPKGVENWGRASLQRALDELEGSRQDRRKLTRDALAELDADIAQCERYLAVIQGFLNDPERRRHLERRLSDLKRERRKETLMNWRDLVWLKAEIRTLQRDIDSFGRAAASGGNRERPR